MIGYSTDEISKRMRNAVQYVKTHKEVNNVLITGGDSFALSNRIIESYLHNFTEINHIDFIRFGTRSLVVYPQRIYQDQDLLQILETYSKKKQIVIVTQFNHPVELTNEALLAIEALKKIGIIIRNQTVLLKGVNDDENILITLLNKLTSLGIHPYYIFQCRPVQGATQFQVPLFSGIDIVNNTRKKLNGIGKGFRYVMSHKLGKIEIIGKTEKQFIFKFHQHKFKEDANQIFFEPLDLTINWLTNLPDEKPFTSKSTPNL